MLRWRADGTENRLSSSSSRIGPKASGSESGLLFSERRDNHDAGSLTGIEENISVISSSGLAYAIAGLAVKGPRS